MADKNSVGLAAGFLVTFKKVLSVSGRRAQTGREGVVADSASQKFSQNRTLAHPMQKVEFRSECGLEHRSCVRWETSQIRKRKPGLKRQISFEGDVRHVPSPSPRSQDSLYLH